MDDTIIDDKINEEKIVPIAPRLIKSARDLKVYQRAYAVSLAIHKQTLQFPPIENYALANQLRRSTKSVCANIAEGFIRQKYSKPDFARFLAIAEASAAESQVWLQYSVDLEYIDKLQYQTWDNDYSEIISMISQLRKKLVRE